MYQEFRGSRVEIIEIETNREFSYFGRENKKIEKSTINVINEFGSGDDSFSSDCRSIVLLAIFQRTKLSFSAAEQKLITMKNNWNFCRDYMEIRIWLILTDCAENSERISDTEVDTGLTTTNGKKTCGCFSFSFSSIVAWIRQGQQNQML